jgi:hypothetical protein
MKKLPKAELVYWVGKRFRGLSEVCYKMFIFFGKVADRLGYWVQKEHARNWDKK